VRSLRHAPAFVVLVVLTLALGVGATTAIFSVVDGILLRPLPYPEPERLVVFTNTLNGEPMYNHSEPEIFDLEAEDEVFAAVAGYRTSRPLIGVGDEPERLSGVLATASLFDVLAVQPTLGRAFTAVEDRSDAAERVAVLSHELWVRAFGADPDILGRSVLFENLPTTIVGVMPPGFSFPVPGIEVYRPLRMNRADPIARNNHYLTVVARLARGATSGAVAERLRALGVRSTQAYPEFYAQPITFSASPMHEDLVGDVRAPLRMLMAAVAGVLLIAAVNAASLFLARGERRRGEIAVRSALGAGRRRVAGQLMAESLIVASLAAVLGSALAWAAVHGLARLAPPNLPRIGDVAINGRVLLFGLSVALSTGLLFGVAPALDAWRGDVRGVLSTAGRTGIGGRGAGRFRRALVLTQLALATLLALGAGLLLRSFASLRRVDLGFDPAGVLTMPLSPPVSVVAPDGEAIAFYRDLEERIAALPGVAAVGSALRIPLADGHDNYSIQVEGREVATIGESPAPGMEWATPGYFQAMRIPLLRGRYFTAADDASAPLVAVIGEETARELWPGEDALGKRLRMFNPSSPWMEVVGVVADVKHYGVREDRSAKLYIPHLQGNLGGYYSPSNLTLFVRTDGDAAALAAPVRELVRGLEPGMPVGAARTMDEVVSQALAPDRFTFLLLGGFAVAALLLAAVGVYGVVAETVARRTREIGLRMAVGADRRRILGQVLREGLGLAVAGAVAGLAGGVWAARVLRTLLYEVTPTDPWTFVVVGPLLVAVTLLASLVPALRAARVDPVEALRGG
jgi:predicted permease